MNKRIKQTLIGFMLIVLGVIIPLVLDGDATVSVVVVPLGIYLIVTKEIVVE